MYIREINGQYLYPCLHLRCINNDYSHACSLFCGLSNQNKNSDFFEIRFSECRNCKIPCAGTLCSICIRNPECTHCKRRLPPGLFPVDGAICRRCLNKLQGGPHRSALNGLVVEYDLPTSVHDADLEVYLNSNSDRIMEILRAAIENHM